MIIPPLRGFSRVFSGPQGGARASLSRPSAILRDSRSAASLGWLLSGRWPAAAHLFHQLRRGTLAAGDGARLNDWLVIRFCQGGEGGWGKPLGLLGRPPW